MAWQRAQVGVRECADEVLILNLESGELIARHAVCGEKGRIIKNNHRDRDQAQRIADLEADVADLLSPQIGRTICATLQRTSPRIYKDQLIAVRNLLRDHAPVDSTLMADLAQRSTLKATMVQSYLEATQRAQARGRAPDDVHEHRRRVCLICMLTPTLAGPADRS